MIGHDYAPLTSWDGGPVDDACFRLVEDVTITGGRRFCLRRQAEHRIPKLIVYPSRGRAFQARVTDWVVECFGLVVAYDRVERNHRFLEEALELVQALGCTREDAHALVDYTFDRPLGDVPQEVGGVLVTLAALCQAAGVEMVGAGEVELDRILGLVEKIRAKQAAKPHGSPLPGPS